MIGIIVVAVEEPARCQEKIPAAHPDRIAVDYGPNSFAFDHEPECVLRVPVFRRGLTGAEILDGTPQSRADIGVSAQARIGQSKRSSLSTAPDGNEISRPLCKGEQLRPLPDVRYGLRHRMPWHQVPDLGPQWLDVLPVEPCVKLSKLRSIIGLHRV
jgi:hypothetical protein